MKTINIEHIGIILLLLFAGCNSYTARNGDIIFQTSLSNQSKAIQAATKSPYSHMGIIYLKEGNPFVFEASKTVKLTPMNEWIKRGKNSKCVVKRLVNADSILSDENLVKMIKVGEIFDGKPYDLYFEWSDDRIYCSELVWKIFKNSIGIEIGELDKLKNFDLSSPDVKKIIEKRYGNDIPLNEDVVSPESMFNSNILKTVYKN
jgi:uncharacterized protein YycO